MQYFIKNTQNGQYLMKMNGAMPRCTTDLKRARAYPTEKYARVALDLMGHKTRQLFEIVKEPQPEDPALYAVNVEDWVNEHIRKEAKI
jgi:hypothetical protein